LNDSRRRTIRTAVQTLVSAAGVLLVVIPVLLQTASQHLSTSQYGTLAGIAAVITGGASLLTRIMALPAVTGFIDTYVPWLSAGERPPHAGPDDDQEPI
jgi:hypothetical protein